MSTESMQYRVLYGTRDDSRVVATFAYAIDARAYILEEWRVACHDSDAWHATDIDSVVAPAIMRLQEDSPYRADHPAIGNDSAWRIVSIYVLGAYGDAHEHLLERASALGCTRAHIGWESWSALPMVRAYMPALEGSARYVDIVATRGHESGYWPLSESWFDAAGDPIDADSVPA